MMRQVSNINWSYIGDAIPSFVTLMFIPFGYSAAYGLIAGLMVYTGLNGMIYITKLVSGGHIVPDDEDHREYWTSKCLAWRGRGNNANAQLSQAIRQAPLVLYS
jgi:AGZA family xanthine/uracil permease-like MFS transporter